MGTWNRRIGATWIVAAIALFTGLLAVASSDPAPDPDQPPALWVAHSRDTVKLDAATGRPLLALGSRGEVRTLLVDPVRARLWTYGERLLRAFALDGTPQLTIRLPRDRHPHRRHRDHGWEGWDEDDDDRDAWEEERRYSRGDRHARLALQPADGTLWVAVDKRLHRYDAEGTLLGTLERRKRIRGLAADPANGWVWVGEQRRLIAYDRQGVEQRRIELARRERLQALTWDAAHRQLWLVLKRKIRRVGSDGTLQLEQRIRNAGHPVADGTGGLWFIDGKRLVRIDETGGELLRLRPFGRHAKLVALAFDPADGGVWVAGAKRMRKVAPDGMLGEVITSGDGRRPPRIFALATDSDLLPPTLAITAPEEGALLNDNRPRIELTADDAGTGVDPDTLTLTANEVPLTVDCEGEPSALSCRPGEALPEGENHLIAVVADRVGNESDPAERRFTIDTVAPTITVDTPVDGLVTNQPAQTLSGALDEPASLTLDGVALTLDGDNRFNEPLTLTEGINAFGLSATDPAGNIGGRTLSLHLDTQAPTPPESGAVTFEALEGGLFAIAAPAGSVEPHATLTVANGERSATTQADAGGAFSLEIAANPGDLLTLIVSDAAGNSGDPLEIALGERLPPDPASVAPPLTGGGFAYGTRFLFEGDNPIQTDVAPGAIEERRLAVIRGRVTRGAGQPLPGVTISIKDHPELGRTLSRADGRFDLAVNGGGLLTLEYRAEAHLPAQRQVNAPWGDFVEAPEVTLVTLDPMVTRIELGADPDVLVVAQGSPVVDEDGERQATLLIPGDTQAVITLPDGTTQALDTLSVRATEYTVGPDGPSRMPGPLPPSSGYTYAVELSADEALMAGATRIDFDRPVPFYVDNFLGFPVGERVPVGWYDAERSAWIPSDDGRVIGIVAVTDGMAEVDGDGDGVADDVAQLTALGFTAKERRRLAELYPVGKSLWRVRVEHFTPWDCNWPVGPPADATPPITTPPVAGTEGTTDSEESTQCPGCVIDVQNQILGEDLPIVGTPYSLHYRSDRQPGHRPNRRLTIPVTGEAVPASLLGVDVRVQVAGQTHRWQLPAEPNQVETFVWNGLDGYGRPVYGVARAEVMISYRYPAIYYPATSEWEQSFSGFSDNTSITIGSRASQTVSSARKWTRYLAGIADNGTDIGGWSLSSHHRADFEGGRLLLGTGERGSSAPVVPVIETIAGGGELSPTLGGEAATAYDLDEPFGIAVSADGTLYLGDYKYIYRVDLDGRLEIIAGNGGYGPDCQTGPALDISFDEVIDMEVASDGSLYFVTDWEGCIRKLGTDGQITMVAGGDFGIEDGVPYYPDDLREDGVPAVGAYLDDVRAIALAPDGGLYFVDESLIRKVTPNGIVESLNSVNDDGYAGDGGSVADALFDEPEALALAPDGSLYVADTDNDCVRRIGVDGVVTTVAGVCGSDGYNGDGIPATEALLDGVLDVAFGPDGNLYLAEEYSDRIRRITPDGVISTIAGNGEEDYEGDNGFAAAASVEDPPRIAFAPDGTLYITEDWEARVRQVRIDKESLEVVSSDGDALYQFDFHGRHLATLDPLTGAERLVFGLDDAGRLTSLTTADGELTTVERSADGEARAIVGPGGQRTELMVDERGYLTEVTNPAGEIHRFSYSDDGLLVTTTDPRGNQNHFEYDEVGRLVADHDPLGGGWGLLREKEADGHTVVLTSGEGRTSAFTVLDLGDGARHQRTLAADGSETLTQRYPDGYHQAILADGTLHESFDGPDPRFGMTRPVSEERWVTTPAGLERVTYTSRTADLSDPDELFSYTELNEIVEVNGRATTTTYLASTRAQTVTTPAGRVAVVTLDEVGRPITRRTGELATTRYHYDERGRLSRLEESDGTTTRGASLGYDALGNIAFIEDALGQRTLFGHDPAGRVISQLGADGRAVGYGYDEAGNLTTLTTPSGEGHAFAYGPRDLESHYTPPELDPGADPATRYRYNLDKELVEVVRPDGQTLTIDYGAGGQLEALHQPTGSTRFGYDATSGQLALLTAPDGATLAYSYDGFLALGERWDGEVAGSVTRAYDDNFWITARAVNGESIAFQYDSDGLLTAAGGLTLTRDTQSGLPSATAQGVVTTARSYNGFGERESDRVEVGGALVMEVTYTRDLLGRIVEKRESVDGVDHTERYRYDSAGRLVEVERDGALTTYTYDGNGNRLTRDGPDGVESGEYDAQDRLVRYDGSDYRYTANGELLTKSDANGTTTYNYDLLGNLLGVDLPDGTRVDYLVDARNRRTGRKVGGVLEQGFLYKDALNPIAELDGAGNVVSRFVYGVKENVPAYMVKGLITYRILSDHLGSPRLVIDTETGAVMQRLEYDAFGRVIEDTNPGFQPFGFAGGLYDRDSGLVRFGARDYDPATGRWTSKDPIRFAGGDTNLYGYVIQDPINLIDPTGEVIPFAILAGKALVGAIAGGYGAYVSSGGDLSSIVTGTLVGAGVGLISPFGGKAIGSFVSNFSASVIGQYAGSKCGGRDIDLSMAAGAGIGGIAGKPAGKLFGQLARHPRQAAAAVEGVFVGFGEALGR